MEVKLLKSHENLHPAQSFPAFYVQMIWTYNAWIVVKLLMCKQHTTL